VVAGAGVCIRRVIMAASSASRAGLRKDGEAWTAGHPQKHDQQDTVYQMQIAVSAGIIGVTPRPDAGPTRLARVNDIVRLFGETGWHEQSPALAAAALALMEGVPRVVVASSLATLPADIELIAITGNSTATATHELVAPPGVTLLVDLTPEVTVADVLAAKARGVRFVHPGGTVMLPGQRRAVRIGGAALALPLLFGHSQLGALVELATPSPIAPALIEAGVLVLTTRTPVRSGPRVVLPAGESPRPRATPLEAAPGGPTAHLEAALNDLARRFTHRLGKDRGAHATLKREAERLLQAEVAAGTITGYALAIEPAGDDLAIDVAVTLPRRVGKVIIRVHQT